MKLKRNSNFINCEKQFQRLELGKKLIIQSKKTQHRMKNKKPMIARVILKINKKSYRKQVNKNKTNSGEPFKPRLTFKTYNS